MSKCDPEESMSGLNVTNVSRFGMLFMQPPTEWDGGIGFVSKDMIEKHCPPPAADVQVCTFAYVFSKIPTEVY